MKSPAYEVIIGSHLNSKCVIRRLGKEKAALLFDGAWRRSRPVLSASKFNRYWVVLDGHCIALGRGRREWLNLNDVLVHYIDPKPLDVRYVGLLTWDVPVQFRSVSVGFLYDASFGAALCAQRALGVDSAAMETLAATDDGDEDGDERQRQIVVPIGAQSLFQFCDGEFLSDVRFVCTADGDDGAVLHAHRARLAVRVSVSTRSRHTAAAPTHSCHNDAFIDANLFDCKRRST